MTVVHATVKVPGQTLAAVVDWNADHVGTTIGSVFFVGAANVIGEDNANLFWNNANKRLGIGTNNPQAILHILKSGVAGTPAISAETAFVVQNNGSTRTRMSIIGSSFSQIYFGDAADENVGIIQYRHAGNWMEFHVNADPFAAITIQPTVVNINWSQQNDIDFRVRAIGVSEAFFVKASTGRVGLGTNNPTTQFSVKEKSGMTPIGGFAIRLTNETGAVSVAGDVVIASTGTADAVALAAGGELQPIGVFLDSGVAEHAEAWVVVAGIADVHMDAGGCALGDRIVTSAVAGRGAVNNLPSVAVHFQEIGHAIEAAAANANARCVMHFL